MKLSEIAKRSKRLSIDIEIEPGKSDKLAFEYRPSAYTADLLKQISEMSTPLEGETEEQQAERNLLQQPVILAQLISWWNATEDDGKTIILPTEEVFSSIDIPLRSALLTAITKDINPDPQTPAPSSGGSFTTGR